MTYPTVPDLRPFADNVTPDLRASGPYNTTLTQIENYLKQLGAYVDAQIAEVRGEIPSSADFATSEQLEGVKQSASAAASAAATAQQTAEEASTSAEEAKSDVTELGDEVNTLDGTVGGINAKVNNILNISYNLPINVMGTSALNKLKGKVFSDDGTSIFFIEKLFNIIGSLMLAAPDNDRTKLFGYLGDNTDNLVNEVPTVRSSAALTAAYEAGGITKESSDPAFTAADLATCKISAEGVPYSEE